MNPELSGASLVGIVLSNPSSASSPSLSTPPTVAETLVAGHLVIYPTIPPGHLQAASVFEQLATLTTPVKSINAGTSEPISVPPLFYDPDTGELEWRSICLVVLMGALSIITVVGNLAVLLSYYIDKNIRQPSNYFIFSLAVSDLV
ncbi:hypothetical protein AB6A40_005216 [Gnathostoma spinigerum]|uniref:G-protein coupled receptors family 1 profile domain-containing protein n=1 Tax=Gnathostoma spinigerum TaxID=75299 RepID=A0ABD6EH04_9BILA